MSITITMHESTFLEYVTEDGKTSRVSPDAWGDDSLPYLSPHDYPEQAVIEFHVRAILTSESRGPHCPPARFTEFEFLYAEVSDVCPAFRRRLPDAVGKEVWDAYEEELETNLREEIAGK